MKSRACAIAVAAAATLAACGGGGDDALREFLQGDMGPTGTCPNGSADDVWINRRLACLTVGQPFILAAGGHVSAGTATGDRAYVINQTASDTGLNNILGTPPGHRKYCIQDLCPRHPPLM